MAEFRRVTVAPGHAIRVRRSPQPSSRPGLVRVINTRRAPMEVSERQWNEGTPA